MSRAKTFVTEGIVLKRVNTGETDRVVTFLTRDFGKLVGVAKGVRSLKSSRRAHLEPGNYLKIFAVYTKGLPLITQTSLLEEATDSRNSLVGMRQLVQVLEVLDRLFMEGDIDQSAYLKAVEIRQALFDQSAYRQLQTLLGSLLEHLGYQDFHETAHSSVLDYVAEITEKRMKSFEYLQVK
ncbi:MAG: DNA repair protein RecO [Candidatus Paceibacterota bacterium]